MCGARATAEGASFSSWRASFSGRKAPFSERNAPVRRRACHLIGIPGLFSGEGNPRRRRPTSPRQARRIATRESSFGIGKRGLISRQSGPTPEPASFRSSPSRFPRRARRLPGGRASSPAVRQARRAVRRGRRAGISASCGGALAWGRGGLRGGLPACGRERLPRSNLEAESHSV